MHRLVGLILNRKNVGQADRRITVLAADGKHELRARGTQKLASKLAGSLEPLTLVDLTVAGRQVTGSTIRDPYRAVHANVPRLASVGLMAAAVDGLIRGPHDDHLTLKILRQGFALVGRSRTNRDLLLAVGYVLSNLLVTQGYHPGSRRSTLPVPAQRLVEIYCRQDPNLLRRVRCSVLSARKVVEEQIREIEKVVERPVAPAVFFWHILTRQKKPV